MPGTSSMRLRSSFLDAITRRNSRTSELSKEWEWEAGGRYEVTRRCALYDQPRLAKKIGEVKPKEVVLLLAIHPCGSGGLISGLVVPPASASKVYAGWILLQGRENILSLKKQKMEGSWEKRARYRVRHPALMRQDLSTDSPLVCEVQPDDEVLVLDIGVYAEEGAVNNVRLRLQVSTEDGDIGWLSPETGPGEKLLDPVNMLGMHAVKVHKQDVRRGSHKGVIKRWSERGTVPEKQSPVVNIPWEVGCQYRVLEKIDLRLEVSEKSKRLCKLPFGAFVMITEMRMMECKKLGICPFALVEVSTSDAKTKLKHTRGWIRCSGSDGRDLIDTRDQLEFDKIHARLSQVPPGKRVTISDLPDERKEISEGASNSYSGDEDEEEESDNEWRESSEDEHVDNDQSTEANTDMASNASPEAVTPDRPPEGEVNDPKLPASVTKQLKAESRLSLEEEERKSKDVKQEFDKKLQSMEIGAKEEKLVDDRTVLTDERFCCSCNCGASY